MTPEGIFIAILLIIVLAAVIAVAIVIIRAAIRRTVGAGSRSIAFGLVTASATALVVFVLVYLSAWAEMRQQVVIGDSVHPYVIKLEMDFDQIQRALLVYRGNHEQYPDSLDQLPDFKGQPLLDPWQHPYQYRRTDNGYSLLSLGRDGKAGGAGLDADIDSDHVEIHFEPTLWQFLFEAAGGRSLLTVALLASLFAGLTCYIASGTREGGLASAVVLLPSIAVTIVGAVLVSLFLVMIYTVGNHH